MIRTTTLLAVFLVVGAALAIPVAAQSPGNSVNGSIPAEAAGDDVLSIIFAGGMTAIIIMVSLAGLSVIAVALSVDHLLTLRRSVLMPSDLAEQVRAALGNGDLAAADKACRAQPSALSTVLRAGLVEAPLGWPSVEKALEESLAEQSARLLRKIDYLSVIGNIAPMIGLLGTVFGMIFAFQEVANTQGAARAAELASGIYQALVTTVGGLIVAIPSLAAFAVFRNRVDQVIAETGFEVQRSIGPLKRVLIARSQGTRATPPTGPGGS